MIQGTRIAIIGNAGGGKSTLARKLGQALNIPVTHVDSIQYQSGWLRTPEEECDQVLTDVANGERWIIDGFGSDELIERRIEIADTVLFLDFPIWRHYWWALKRQFAARNGQREELPTNCPEFNFAYTKKLINVMWLVHKEYTPWFRQLLKVKGKSGNVVIMHGPEEVKRLLRSTEAQKQVQITPRKNVSMTYAEFNKFCSALPATSHVIQWGGSHVWKVGGKVFSIGGWAKADKPAFTFKTSELNYHFLSDQPGYRPAPYFASRGMKWIQQFDVPGTEDDELMYYLTESHRIVSLGLTRKKQKELGLNQD